MVVLVLVLVAGTTEGFPLPPPLETGHLLGRGLPVGVPPVALADEFYALGWSPNNQFAYLVRRSLPDGQYQLVLKIDDLVQDKTLYQAEWADWGHDQDGWWQAQGPGIEARFRQWGVVPTTYQLGEFPLILDNEYFTVVLRPEAEPRAPGWVGRWTVLAHSTGRGIKTVQTLSGYWRWAAVLGFIPSPFENRVALVTLVQPAGWAGPGQPLRFGVTGLSLKAGFPTP